MIEYLVRIKEIEIYDIPVTAKSEQDAIDKAHEILDNADKEEYHNDSTSKSEVM